VLCGARASVSRGKAVVGGLLPLPDGPRCWIRRHAPGNPPCGRRGSDRAGSSGHLAGDPPLSMTWRLPRGFVLCPYAPAVSPTDLFQWKARLHHATQKQGQRTVLPCQTTHRGGTLHLADRAGSARGSVVRPSLQALVELRDGRAASLAVVVHPDPPRADLAVLLLLRLRRDGFGRVGPSNAADGAAAAHSRGNCPTRRRRQ